MSLNFEEEELLLSLSACSQGSLLKTFVDAVIESRDEEAMKRMLEAYRFAVVNKKPACDHMMAFFQQDALIATLHNIHKSSKDGEDFVHRALASQGITMTHTQKDHSKAILNAMEGRAPLSMDYATSRMMYG